MIRDIDELKPGEVLHTEVAIVGAGLAGIDLARYLGQRGCKVMLLESGRDEFDPHIQELSRFETRGKKFRDPANPDASLTPDIPPHLRGEIQVRQFGGTSSAWSGKWRTFENFDFEEKPWVPWSGWPISRGDLEPYYREIASDYGIADVDSFVKSKPVVEARERCAKGGIHLLFHYSQKETLRPAVRFRAELERTCEVVLGATATEILLGEGLQRVQSIVFRSLSGGCITVVADHFVLSAGGLEVVRLLLASNKQIEAGIGNASGLLGRFYMDHPKFKRGRLYPGPTMRLLSEWTRKSPRPRFSVNLSLTEKVQKERQLLDQAIQIIPVYEYQVDYPGEVIETLKQGIQSANPKKLAGGIWRLASAPRSLWKVLQRRYYEDRAGKVAYFKIQFHLEQAPDPDSRLSLSSEKDALGVPRLAIDWRLSRLDHEALPKMIECFVKGCSEAGLGKVDFGTEPFTLDQSVDGAHLMGATRMAASPEHGVVDCDCRVYGTSNLFIASSSVFPTGHSAAPTMTILALGRRLGHHLLALREDIRRSKASPSASAALPPGRMSQATTKAEA